jgi:hypothetical protein
MITGTNLLFFNTVLMWGFLQTVTPGRSKIDKVALVLSGFASLGLGIVGAVNEQEDNPIHSGGSFDCRVFHALILISFSFVVGGAVVFFFMYEVYMVIVTTRFWRADAESRRRISSVSMAIRVFLTGACFISLALFVVYSGDWHKNHIKIAFCEWYAPSQTGGVSPPPSCPACVIVVTAA